MTNQQKTNDFFYSFIHNSELFFLTQLGEKPDVNDPVRIERHIEDTLCIAVEAWYTIQNDKSKCCFDDYLRLEKLFTEIEAFMIADEYPETTEEYQDFFTIPRWRKIYAEIISIYDSFRRKYVR